MDSYGEILKSTREEKNLDLDKISRELTIEKRYLVALEEEDSGVFPGEAYLTGFLKNYSKYLELDPDYVLKLYQNKLIQEAPVPQDLLAKKKIPTFFFTVIIPIVVVAVFAIVTFVLISVKKSKQKEADSLKQKQNTTSKIEITEKKFNDRVYKGDQLLIPTENGGNIVLTVKDTLSSFGLETPNGTFYVDLAEEAEIDIDGDNVSDFILYVSDISSTDYKRGAEISVLLRHGFVFADGSSDSVDLAEIPFANELKNKHPYKVILEDNRAYPFTVNISFRGSCLFRDRVDRNPAIETYFERGELFTATPKNGIRLWISNANALKITIIADAKTFDLDIGEAGKILVEDIKWIKDSDGKYKLVVIELD